MGAVAKKQFQCGCGTQFTEQKVVVKWQTNTGMSFIIREVPSLICPDPDCSEVAYSSKVEYNLSLLAERMEKGTLEADIIYFELF